MSKDRGEDGRFTKGNCANPNGRPKKGNTMTDALRDYLELPASSRSNMTNKEKLIAKIVANALSADKQASNTALKYIMDRLDGKAVQQIAQSILNMDDIVVKVEGLDDDNLSD